MFSIATDFVHPRNDVEPCLRSIAESGFGAVHWCQQWNTDYIYTASEITAIKSWLSVYGLVCQDLHASAGREKNWGAPDEYARRAGIELIGNRLRMTAELGGDAIVLHLAGVENKEGRTDEAASFEPLRIDAMRRSMDELISMAESSGVRIALENMPSIPRRNALISKFLEDYDSPWLGICYDAGHGNILDRSQEWLRTWKDRLNVVHLHDNMGQEDQHILPFEGTTDWPKVMALIGSSISYRKALNLEVGIYAYPGMDAATFLGKALGISERLEKLRNNQGTFFPGESENG